MGGLDCGFVAVGFDGTPESVAATRWALDRAAGTSAAVKIVHCWRRSETAVHGAQGAWGARHRRTAAIRAAEDVVAAARATGRALPEVGMVFAAGPVESVLAVHAQGASMLVLGASSPGVLGDPAQGPVAGPCLQRVRCPIVVVDRQGRVATARPRSPVLGLAG